MVLDVVESYKKFFTPVASLGDGVYASVMPGGKVDVRVWVSKSDGWKPVGSKTYKQGATMDVATFHKLVDGTLTEDAAVVAEALSDGRVRLAEKFPGGESVGVRLSGAQWEALVADKDAIAAATPAL